MSVQAVPEETLMQLVVVTWLDAHTIGNDEIAESEAVGKTHFGWPTHTVGWLVKSDDDGVTLTTDVISAKGEETERCFRGLHFIPRGMVQAEHKFNPPKRKGR